MACRKQRGFLPYSINRSCNQAEAGWATLASHSTPSPLFLNFFWHPTLFSISLGTLEDWPHIAMEQITELPMWAKAGGVLFLIALVISLFFVVKSLIKLLAAIIVVGLLVCVAGYFYFYHTDSGRNHLRELQQGSDSNRTSQTNLLDGISDTLKREGTEIINQGKDKVRQKSQKAVDRLLDQ